MNVECKGVPRAQRHDDGKRRKYRVKETATETEGRRGERRRRGIRLLKGARKRCLVALEKAE